MVQALFGEQMKKGKISSKPVKMTRWDLVPFMQNIKTTCMVDSLGFGAFGDLCILRIDKSKRVSPK